MSEADLARAVVHQLEAWGFDVYQEVSFGGPRADIVGVRGKVVCVVEAKAALTFDVIAQAEEWKRHAHWPWIAVPRPRIGPSRGRWLAYSVCAERGIGVLEVAVHQGNRLHVHSHPRLNRAAQPKQLLDALRPQHKTFAAAGTSGAYWSQWKDSVSRIVQAVDRQPGLPLRELVKLVRHHWASDKSAASCIARQIADGAIKELRLVHEGKAVKVYRQEGKV